MQVPILNGIYAEASVEGDDVVVALSERITGRVALTNIMNHVTDEMIAWKTEGTRLYQQLPSDCFQGLKECDPFREEEPNRPEQPKFYDLWKNQS